MSRASATIWPITSRASVGVSDALAHAPQPMQHDSGNGVHHGRECGQRQNVSRDFDGALFGRALDLLDAIHVRHRADMPDVVQDGARVAGKQRR